MSVLWERVNAALDEVEPDELAGTPPSDGVKPQLIQASGTLGQAYDSAKFSTQLFEEAGEAFSQMAQQAKVFCGDLKALAELSEAEQEAFEDADDGFALTRIQDITAKMSEAAEHVKAAHQKFTEATHSADRYREEIKKATTR